LAPLAGDPCEAAPGAEGAPLSAAAPLEAGEAADGPETAAPVCAALMALADEEKLIALESGETSGRRGNPWVIEGIAPPPDRPSRPPRLWVLTAAFCPGAMVAASPVARLVTSTAPRSTATLALSPETLTVKAVPFTTAASSGVSTEKCWTFCLSTSKCAVPIRSSTVVCSPGVGSELTARIDLGPTRMLSAPRTIITRVCAPVNSVAPGGTSAPTASSLFCDWAETIQA
jgi:hypothetical protein